MLFFALWGLYLAIKKNFLLRIIVLIVWLLSTIALVLSYTRAAWVSVIVSLLVLIAVKLKLKFRFFLIFGIFISIYTVIHRTDIWQKFENNREVSSTVITKHIKSISNIKTDESNLERINRWNSAFRMTKERPFFGWGANTYMYNYAPYQKSSEKTSISTDFGELGNVHSEYIGPLVETGIPGALSFLLICVLTLITGFKVYRKISDTSLKQVILFLILAYITYLVHGIMNNFLDTDKISALFWGFTAIFVSLDISLKELDTQH
jgi:O-antigen ligase